MTIMNNESKVIEFSHSTMIHEKMIENEDHKEFKYIPDLPVVICNTRRDARVIQEKVNKFIYDLSCELINGKKYN